MREPAPQSTLGPAQPRPRVGATRRTYVRACAKKNSIAARARAATGSPLPALGRGSSWGRRRLNARASRAASTSARLPRTFSFLRVVRFGAFAPTAARRGRARPRVLAVRGGTLPAISAASSVRAVASAGAATLDEDGVLAPRPAVRARFVHPTTPQPPGLTARVRVSQHVIVCGRGKYSAGRLDRAPLPGAATGHRSNYFYGATGVL